MRKLIFFLFLALALTGCKVNKPKGIIDESTMEQILYEYHLAKAVATGGDSVAIKSRAYVLASLHKNGVTEAEFDSSMVWYCQHMEYLQKIYQRIDERYRSELASLGAATNDINRYSSLSTTGDTANVWNAHSFYLLSGNGYNNRISFEVKADTSFKSGDSFMLNFRAEFLQREGQRHGIVTLAVQYANDSVATVVRHFYGSGDNQLTLPSVNLRAKRVYGFIYMMSEWNVNPRLLFIFQPSLVRMRYVKSAEPEPSTTQAGRADSVRRDSTNRHVSYDSIGNKATLHGGAGGSGEKSLNPEMMHSRPVPRKMSH